MAASALAELDPARVEIFTKLQHTLRSFTANERFQGFVVAAEQAPNIFPTDYLRYLVEQKYLAMDIPEEYGGQGLSALEAVVTVEQLCREHAGTGLMALVQNSLTAFPIREFGTPEQKEKYLRKMANGELFASFALTEPATGSDAKDIELKAEWDEGRKGWRLKGKKQFITGANGAGIIVVAARTGTKESREEGISTFIVEIEEAEEFEVGTIYKKVGQAGSPLCELNFNDLFVPESALLGEKNVGGGR